MESPWDPFCGIPLGLPGKPWVNSGAFLESLAATGAAPNGGGGESLATLCGFSMFVAFVPLAKTMANWQKVRQKEMVAFTQVCAAIRTT